MKGIVTTPGEGTKPGVVGMPDGRLLPFDRSALPGDFPKPGEPVDVEVLVVHGKTTARISPATWTAPSTCSSSYPW